MSHPPIPPNNPHFYQHDNSQWFWFFSPLGFNGGSTAIDHEEFCDSKLKTGERNIISAVARTAWLDAEPRLTRYSDDNYEELRHSCDGERATESEKDQHETNKKNAHEWRVWGERK